MFGDERPELADQLRANVSRFSAYKAAYVRREIDSVAADGTMTEEERKAMTKATISQFSRWTDAELTTATARARTAKQFSEYNDPDRLRLFPNLRWIPSRSAAPRAAHVPFYNRVWAKDDNFWTNHSPGTEWNCKCDIEETDDAVTDNKEVKPSEAPRGLEGNPAKTGEIFTDKASYIRETSRTKGKQVVKMMNNIEWLRTKNDKEKRERFKQMDSSCVIVNEKRDVAIISETYGEISHAMAFSENHVLKNEGIELIPEWLKNAECVGRKESDASHNTGKTKRLKERTDYFYYFKTKLFGKYDCYIHVGRYREDKRLYLYTIAEGEPKDLESPIW